MFQSWYLPCSFALCVPATVHYGLVPLRTLVCCLRMLLLLFLVQRLTYWSCTLHICTKSKENHLGHCFWPTYIKGRGPLLVLVYPCFRENVTVKCKIVSFLCTGSSDNFLLKNVIVFLLGNQVSKWHSFEIWGKKKKLHLTIQKNFLVTREKAQKNQHISHTLYIHVFCPPQAFWLILPCQFCENISYMAMRFELDTQKGWRRYIFHHVTLHF